MHGSQTLTICSPQLGIDPESNLGGAVYDREILRALAECGAHIVVPLPKGERHEAVDNWEVIRTRIHLWKYYEYNWIFRKAVSGLLAEGRRFDILRAHTAHSVGAGLLGLARRHNVPAHLHYHHWERHPIRNFIERRTLHRYDLVTTDSEYSKRDLVERFGLRNRVEIIYPGVSKTCLPQRDDPDLRERYRGRKVLLTAGVLIERKNHSFLLRVMKQILESCESKPVLVIVGGGPLEEQLRQEAGELGLSDAVEFAGQVPEATKRAYYALCDVFVFPSLLEGFGMVAAEAMAYRKPVVASNRTSIPEIVDDGQTGFLADPTNESEFAERIGLLLASPELREKMGQAARQRVNERFDFGRSAERLLSIYYELTRKAN